MLQRQVDSREFTEWLVFNSIEPIGEFRNELRHGQMMALHELHPQYGFAQHMGYPTEAHFAALKEFGACDQHRRSFSPVRNVLALHSR
ncbi:MAG: Ribonuclease [Pseudomonadota bacterium]